MPPGSDERLVPRLRLREFFSPAPLAAVAVLALNDHVLKARYPGLATGKLSDLAGCFVLPLFLSAVVAYGSPWGLRVRLALGGLATFTLFVAVKTSALGAHVVARALSAAGAPLGLRPSVIVADPTDLVALPMIALAVWYGIRAERQEA